MDILVQWVHLIPVEFFVFDQYEQPNVWIIKYYC